MYVQLLLALFLAFTVCVACVPLCIKAIKRFQLVDDPQKRKHPATIHRIPIPRGGGLPIYISMLVSTIVLIPINHTIFAILIAGFFVMFIGLLDDKYDLSPYLRFFTNILLASVVVASGVTIPYITNPFGGILDFQHITIPFLHINLALTIPHILAIVWIVWVMNMLNWSKGVDGQMPGIAAISAMVIGIASLRFPFLEPVNIQASMMAFIVAGSALGFLIFNFYPAKIFPGYSGTILGFTLGVLSILSGVKLATALLVMGVPTADALFTITRRLLAKKSPFWHDKGHLHHLLLDMGLGHRAISLFYWVMSGVLGLIALNLSSRGKLFAIILVIVVVSGFILSLKYIVKKGRDEK